MDMDLSNRVTLSEGVNADTALPELARLLQNGWELNKEGTGVRKQYTFNTYTKVMDFANCIATKSKRENHHSTMTLTARTVAVDWTTHVPAGLSAKDLKMAASCDDFAAEMVVPVEASQAAKCQSCSKA